MNIICYSCGRGEKPENSLEGIKHCQTINQDFRIEMDIQMTADNQLVLFHDKNTFRTTGVRATINQLQLKKLRELNIAFNFKQDGTFPYRDNPINITTLKEVFETFPKAKFILDIHTKNQNVIDVFIELIHRHFKKGDFVVVSEYDAIVKSLKTKQPDWIYGVPAYEAKKMLYSSFIYMDQYFPIKSDILMLPKMYGKINVLSKRVIRHAQYRNKPIWAWLYESTNLDTTQFKAIETADEYLALEKLGISGVFTEYPEKLSKAIKNHKQP